MPWPIRPPPITPMVCGGCCCMEPSMSRRGTGDRVTRCSDESQGHCKLVAGSLAATQENGHANAVVDHVLVVSHGRGGLLVRRSAAGARFRQKPSEQTWRLAGGVAAVHIHDLPGAEIRRRRQQINRHPDEILHFAEPT